jgi:hypothetical protein
MGMSSCGKKQCCPAVTICKKVEGKAEHIKNRKVLLRFRKCMVRSLVAQLRKDQAAAKSATWIAQ